MADENWGCPLKHRLSNKDDGQNETVKDKHCVDCFFASLDEETNYSNSSSSSTVTYRRYSSSSSLLPRQRQCTRTDFISACMADHAHFWVLSTHIRDHHAVRRADKHNICRNSTPFSSIYIRRTICIMRHRNQSPVIPLHCRCLDR